MNTTDVEMSAIRIFLESVIVNAWHVVLSVAIFSDESHKTIATTPDTTCSEILSKILCKLGLTQDKDDYVLQLQYASGIVTTVPTHHMSKNFKKN